MTDRPYNVLFLTTGNSARSIIAEAILNKIGAGKFRGYSAGSLPKGKVHSETLQLLASLGYDTAGLRSKSLPEFLKGPQFDFVLTVCDDVASEAPPIWPGRPTTAHWGIADPAEAKGTPAQISLAFKEAYRLLNQRIGVFAALPLRSLDQPAMSRLATVLWKPPGASRFCSRQTWHGQVAYNSQFLSATDRVWSAKSKLNNRICRAGGFDADEWEFPPKPKWMRWRTYERLEARYDQLENKLDQEIGLAALKLIKAKF